MDAGTRLEGLLEPGGEASAPPHAARWRELQTYLKFRHLNSTGTSGAQDAEQAVQSEKDFLRLLCEQLRRVDKHFRREARRVLAAFGLHAARCRLAAALRALLCCQPAGRQAPLQLAARARWCLRYAQLNHAALRRVAEERDSLFGGSLGSEFVQACFRGEVEVYSFLSPASLSELAAVEQAMLLRAGPAAAAAEPRAQPAAGSSQLAEGGEGEAQVAADHLCAICLDLLFQPVSLSCGHVFCARCALAAATGSARAVGPAHLLLETPACYHSGRRCPCCRARTFGSRHARRSPFWDVQRLVHLEAVLKARYPEEWARRKAEDAAQQAGLRAQGQSSWRSWTQGRPALA